MKNLIEKEIEIDGNHYKIASLLRKIYSVRDKQFDNSTEASQYLEKLKSQGEYAKIEIVRITPIPKKSFWELWKTKSGKKAFKMAGVYVTKEDGKYMITETKPTRRKILENKGYYRSFHDLSGKELEYYDAALKDAIRDGDGPGSETEKANLRDLRKEFGLRPSEKYK